jgi:hypothetical protein
METLGANAIIIDGGADADARARSEGAEWLLAVRGEVDQNELHLFAELRKIDPGLWLAPPDPNAVQIFATAEHRSTLSSIPKPVDPPPPRTDRPRLEGPALRIQSFDEPVLALRACRLSSPDADDLAVLTFDAVTIYSLLDGRIRKVARYELGPLARHRTPVREPIGSIACSGSKIAFGHSGLAKGHLLAAKVAKKKMTLEPIGELAGIPLAALPKERWLLAETESGTSRYHKEMMSRSGSEAAKVTLEGPILDAAAFEGEVPEGWRLLAVTADYQLVRFGDRLAEAEKIGPSGVGISVFLLEGRPHAIATSPKRDGGRDQLSLLSGAETSRPVPVEGLVFATAVGKFRGAALDLVAASRADERTDLFLLRLWEPK